MRAKPIARAELRGALVPREPGDHKGVFGHVLVAAGSRGMAGAAILAGRAALRSGAGLVTMCAPAGAAPTVAAALPCAMTLALPESAAGSFVAEGVGRLQDYARERRATVLAIGPGLTTGPDAEAFVLRALRTTLPAVVDADALNILARRGPRAATSRAPRVFTPHPGEAARLLGSTVSAVESDRPGSAARLARRLGGVVLLKGRGTVIASGSALAVNSTGGPGLAKGGSGDVLAGLIAGLWAQMLASGRTTGELPFRAAALGAWLHGKAGELAEEALTPWAMTPADVVERLPAAFKALSA